MNLDAVPIWLIFAVTSFVVVLSIEAGYRLGRSAHKRSEEEKESPIAGVAGAGLGLLAFILAFTFGIVADRYDGRKELIREDANAVRTAYERADFLPDPDRNEAKSLLRNYLGSRIAFSNEGDLRPERVAEFQLDMKQIHDRLWEMAVENARQDMNSDVAALYIESLNHLVDIHVLRVVIGAQTRIPGGIWMVLYGLTVLAMIGMGYHAGISGSRRSFSTLILAVSFALVVSMIAALDRPTGFMAVTQQPLIDLQNSMAADGDSATSVPETP